MSINGTLVEDKMRRFKGECEHFIFNKCPIYTHDGASAKFSTNSQERITVSTMLRYEQEQGIIGFILGCPGKGEKLSEKLIYFFLVV